MNDPQAGPVSLYLQFIYKIQVFFDLTSVHLILIIHSFNCLLIILLYVVWLRCFGFVVTKINKVLIIKKFHTVLPLWNAQSQLFDSNFAAITVKVDFGDKFRIV